MIVVTGSKGFIGSQLLLSLHRESPIMMVDEYESGFANSPAGPGFAHARWRVNKNTFINWVEGTAEMPVSLSDIRCIVHMGACTDTMCEDWSYLTQNNVEYSLRLWNFCARNGIQLIYASSGATYGDGTNGFSDDHSIIKSLIPLNMYGWSKHLVDLYATTTKLAPPSWAGLKFTNVYGPCEMHKGSMASMVYQSLMQAEKNGRVRLFNYGEQTRDFVHVDDVVAIIKFLMSTTTSVGGIYNVGSGTPESFNAVAEMAFETVKKRRIVEYFEMPRPMDKVYQRHTLGDISKLRAIGYAGPTTSLMDGMHRLARNMGFVGLAD